MLSTEGGGVVGDAEIDPPGVGGDVIDTVRDRLAEFGNGKVVHPHWLGLALGPQLTSAVLEVPDKLLLLGIDRDCRIAGGLESGHLGIDVLELGGTVGVAGTLARLGMGLQAEAQAAEQAADQLLAGGEALLGERRRQMALAFADPQQGSFGIAADRRLHQVIQGVQNPWLRLDRRLAAAAHATHASAEVFNSRPQIGQAAINRAARNPGCPRYPDHPAATRRARFAGREQPPSSLVQKRRKRLEASLDGGNVDHPSRIDAAAATSRRLPGSFVAFLAPV
jgi:hypothetical protein